MTDWLSEIEARNKRSRHGPHRQLPESRSERMARVLRELGKVADAAEPMLHMINPDEYSQEEDKLAEALINLSDDAKALIDQE